MNIPTFTGDDDGYVPMGDSQPSESMDRTFETNISLLHNQPTEIDRHTDEPSDIDHSSQNSTTWDNTEEFQVLFIPVIHTVNTIQHETIDNRLQDTNVHIVQTPPTELTTHNSQINHSPPSSYQTTEISIDLPVPRITKRSISSEETDQANKEINVKKTKRQKSSA